MKAFTALLLTLALPCPSSLAGHPPQTMDARLISAAIASQGLGPREVSTLPNPRLSALLPRLGVDVGASRGERLRFALNTQSAPDLDGGQSTTLYGVIRLRWNLADIVSPAQELKIRRLRREIWVRRAALAKEVIGIQAKRRSLGGCTDASRRQRCCNDLAQQTALLAYLIGYSIRLGSPPSCQLNGSRTQSDRRGR